MSFNRLPVAFPWYDNIEKQNRFRPNSKDGEIYGLITPSNALLPFQFYKTPTDAVTTWEIFTINGVLAYTLDATARGLIHTVLREGRTYHFYNGAPLTTAGGVLAMAEGLYYSRITAGGELYFSEVFQVPACSFVSTDPASAEFLRFEWYNDSDLKPIFYNEITGGGVPYFRNIIYLDTFIHAEEPEIQEDAVRDGNGEAVPTFQKVIRRHKITDLVPDFLKVALVVMTIHDHILITDRKGLETGETLRVTVASTLEYGGAFSTVEISFEEDLATIKKGCGDNMA